MVEECATVCNSVPQYSATVEDCSGTVEECGGTVWNSVEQFDGTVKNGMVGTVEQ